MIEINSNTYNQIKNWVQNQSKNVISLSPIVVFKTIKADKLIIIQCLEQLCDAGILQRQFSYTCKCGEDYIGQSLLAFPDYCTVCGEKLDDLLSNSFIKYKIIKRECDK